MPFGRRVLALALLAACSGDGGDEDLPAFDAAPRVDGSPAADAVPLEPPGPDCGDGDLDPNEDCDDGNQDDGDACVGCRHAVCGDGVLRRTIEQCDDGNLGEDDGCTTRCLQCDGATRYAGASGRCYTRVDGVQAYNLASRSCGFGHLLVPGSRAGQTLVFDAILAGTSGPYWIGLSDVRVEGTFEWVSFATRPFNDWNSGQPDGGAAADCVGLGVATQNWYDFDCSTARKFVCQDDGDWLFRLNGHGYRVVWARATHAEATSTCADLGGYIASLTEGDEADLVLGGVASDVRVRPWIGASDAAVEGTWTWTTGEAFVYSAWAANEPSGNGDCAVLARDRNGWDDVDCAGRRPFVCEVE